MRLALLNCSLVAISINILEGRSARLQIVAREKLTSPAAIPWVILGKSRSFEINWLATGITPEVTANADAEREAKSAMKLRRLIAVLSKIC